MDLLKKLETMGAFVPAKVTKKEIKISRPDSDQEESMAVYVRAGTAADDIEIARASEREQPFVAILRYISDKDGKQIFTDLEQVMTLTTWMVMPLFNAISEVNAASPKKSAPKTSSGVNSPSPSAAEASKNGSQPSAETRPDSGSSTAGSAAP